MNETFTMIDLEAIRVRQAAGGVGHWSDIPGDVARAVCASAGYTDLDKCGIGVIKSAAREIATKHAPADIATLLAHTAALAQQAAVQAQRAEAAEAVRDEVIAQLEEAAGKHLKNLSKLADMKQRAEQAEATEQALRRDKFVLGEDRRAEWIRAENAEAEVARARQEARVWHGAAMRRAVVCDAAAAWRDAVQRGEGIAAAMVALIAALEALNG